MKTVLTVLCMMLLLAPTAAAAVSVERDMIEVEMPEILFEILLPTVAGLDDLILAKAINAALYYPILTAAQEMNEIAREDHAHFATLELPYPWRPYDFFADYSLQKNDGRYLSFVQSIYQYSGGAHGMSFLLSVNADLKQGRLLTSLNQMDLVADYYSRILAEINAQIAADRQRYFSDSVDYFNEEAFYLTGEGIVIYYQLYEIAPYVSGFSEFLIPWDMVSSK